MPCHQRGASNVAASPASSAMPVLGAVQLLHPACEECEVLFTKHGRAAERDCSCIRAAATGQKHIPSRNYFCKQTRSCRRPDDAWLCTQKHTPVFCSCAQAARKTLLILVSPIMILVSPSGWRLKNLMDPPGRSQNLCTYM